MAKNPTVEQISIEFQQATLTGHTSIIGVEQGGAFQLTSTRPLQLPGTFRYDLLNISTDAINFQNNSLGVPIDGTVRVYISATKDPMIKVTNFSGRALLSWQTKRGPETHPLNPGQPILLVGFIR